MVNQIKFSDLREKFRRVPMRPKRLRFFSELSWKAQEFAVSEEQNRSGRFDWDDAGFLTEDFKSQLAVFGFEETEVYWSLGYCQGDGVAFYGRVHAESLKEKDRKAKRLIDALEAADDTLYIEITGENGHYHHWNSMSVEIEFENGTEDDEKPARLKIARPALRENLEEYLNERVREISRELEKSGYAEIEYAYDENAIRDELCEREHLYEKDGTRAMTEFEFYEWKQADSSATQNNQEKQAASSSKN
ncbi:MAG: hypothetical protein H0W58_10985 [Acidobacteria bacterium]|jgi:hypothetical protein|nr:hypothetical protein [Acidobacteriota bacterium]